MNKFEDLGLSHELITAIEKLGFDEPTQIQKESIPLILKGKEVIGESATGSGKTLAFGCGIIEHAIQRGGIQALILTPTRELAEQVKESLRQLSKYKKLKITAVYGGVPINKQIQDLSRAEVVVATPGRLLDHLNRRTIDTRNIKTLVLDEADRMFDMGFIDDVEKIIKACPTKRQNLFFSATISGRIQNLANRHMTEPIKVSATKMVDPKKLKQTYYDIPRREKLSLLVHLLNNEKSSIVMIFCNTRRTTDFVTKNLRANKIHSMAIHGGMTQNKRNNTIQSFNGASGGAIVCTDVAARGLHIANISHVYNYELPNEPTDYVHRIGRTARAGEEGIVINLLCEQDYDNFSRIIHKFRDFDIKEIEIPTVERIKVVKMDTTNRSTSRPRGGSRFPSSSRRSSPRRDGRVSHNSGRRK